MADITNGLAGADCTNGFVMADITNGLAGSDCTNGYVMADITNGLAGADCTNGFVMADITNGLAGADCTNGFVMADITNGFLMSDFTNGLQLSAESDPFFHAYAPTLLARLRLDENNIALNAFRIQSESLIRGQEMIQFWFDGYVDDTGIDYGLSENAIYDSSNRYFYASGGPSKSVHIDQDGPYIVTNYPATASYQGDMSWACWVKIIQHTTYWLNLFSISEDPFSGTYMQMGTVIGEQLGYYGNGVTALSALTVPLDGLWHHYAFSFDSANTSLTFYLDGVADTPVAYAISSVNSNGPVIIGNAPNDLGSYSGGNIFDMDEAGMWNRALQQSDVDYLYSYGVGGEITNETALVWACSFNYNLSVLTGNYPFAPSSYAPSYSAGQVPIAGNPTYASLVSTNFSMIATPYMMAITTLMWRDENESVALNTDVVCYVSADNGTNYQQVNVQDTGLYYPDKRFLSGVVTNINNNGTSARYKILLTNALSTRLHGTSISYK
jgi:hypothetical protein